MHRIIHGFIFLIAFTSCDERNMVYENGSLKIYGNQLEISIDVLFDKSTDEVLVFNQMEIEQSNIKYKDSVNAYYTLINHKNHPSLYLLDTFPIGKNWNNELTQVLSWSLSNLTQPTQILDHSLITELDIEELLIEIEELKVDRQELSSTDITLLLKKLYILNLRCCMAEDTLRLTASSMLNDFELFYELNPVNRKLKERLLYYLNKYE